MNKVFIVTSGAYSDYGINSVFSSREKAQAWVDKHANPSGYRIEEYEVDECAAHVKLTRHEVAIDLESGDIIQTRAHDWIGPANVRSEPCEFIDFRRTGRSSGYPTFGFLFGRVISYVNAEHALKLAAECRQEWLRKKTEITV
jgi:hypothetical protein